MARHVEVMWQSQPKRRPEHTPRVRAEITSQDAVLAWCRAEAAKRGIPLHQYLKEARGK